ncbi:MAG: MerR family transcriptional regulator [Patescibacteria group bacterium]
MRKKVQVDPSDKYLIPKGNVFYTTILEYFSGEHFKKTRNNFNMRQYTVGDTKIPYRVINNWDKNKLLPKSLKNNEGWRKFTFVELVWLKAIERFRAYGFSLDKIARVKATIVDWDKNHNEAYSSFEYYVARACFSDDDPYIVALVNGVGGIGSTEEIEIARQKHYKTNDMLLISLKSIVKEMGLEPRPPRPLVWLSKTESEVVSDVVRSGEKDEVKIKLRKNKITEIQTSKTEIGLSDQEVKKLNGEDKMYGSILVKYENGKRQSVHITKKKRVSDD